MIIANRSSAISMSEVGASAKVSRTTLYRYFSTRDQLLGAVLTDDIAAFEFDLFAALQNVVAPDRRLAIIAERLDAGLASQRAYYILSESPGLMMHLTTQAYEHSVDVLYRVMEPLFELAESLSGRKLDRLLIVHVCARFYTSLNLFPNPPLPDGTRRSIETLLRTLLQMHRDP